MVNEIQKKVITYTDFCYIILKNIYLSVNTFTSYNSQAKCIITAINFVNVNAVNFVTQKRACTLNVNLNDKASIIDLICIIQLVLT